MNRALPSLRAPDQRDEGERAWRRPASREGGRYLTFLVDGEEYGVEIHRIVEVVQVASITVLSADPAATRGVVDLAGEGVPVVNLRVRLGLQPGSVDQPRVILVRVGQGVAGLLVDRVSGVLEVSSSEFQPVAPSGSLDSDRLLRGIGRVGGDVQLLLDIDGVLECLAWEKHSVFRVILDVA